LSYIPERNVTGFTKKSRLFHYSNACICRKQRSANDKNIRGGQTENRLREFCRAENTVTTMNTDSRQQIETALGAFSGTDLRATSIGLSR